MNSYRVKFVFNGHNTSDSLLKSLIHNIFAIKQTYDEKITFVIKPRAHYASLEQPSSDTLNIEMLEKEAIQMCVRATKSKISIG